MANKFLIIGVVAAVLVAGVAGAALLLSNQGGADEVEKRAHFEVTSLTLSDQTVTTGQPLSASIGMKNNGTADGDYEVRLFLDGVQVNRTLISLGVGNTTTVELGFVCNAAGTPTVRVESTNTTFNCLDQFVVGDFMKWHITGYDAETAQAIDAYWSTQVVSVNSTSYSVKETYDGLPLANGTYEHPFTELWSDNLDNLTFIEMEDVLTEWGTKTLSHYNYTYDNGGYHFVYDLYIDEVTATRFKISTSIDTTAGMSTMYFELVETNKVWVSGI